MVMKRRTFTRELRELVNLAKSTPIYYAEGLDVRNRLITTLSQNGLITPQMAKITRISAPFEYNLAHAMNGTDSCKSRQRHYDAAKGLLAQARSLVNLGIVSKDYNEMVDVMKERLGVACLTVGALS